jgi:hypothetical protein
MNRNLSIAALVFSIIALVLSFSSFVQTGGLEQVKQKMLTLEFKMETRKYLLEAKAHLLEAKALYDFKKQPGAALLEIKKAGQFLAMAKLTAAENEIKKIEAAEADLTTLEDQIDTGIHLKENSLDKLLNFVDRFLELIKK